MQCGLLVGRYRPPLLFHSEDKAGGTFLRLRFKAEVSGLELTLRQPKFFPNNLLKLHPIHERMVLVVLPSSGTEDDRG